MLSINSKTYLPTYLHISHLDTRFLHLYDQSKRIYRFNFIHSIRTFSVIQFSRTIFEEEVIISTFHLRISFHIRERKKKISISREKWDITAGDIINKDFLLISVAELESKLRETCHLLIHPTDLDDHRHLCLVKSHFLESVRFYPNFYKYISNPMMLHALCIVRLFRNFREREIRLLKASADRFR